MQHAFACDCHNHSACSPDGHDSAAAMCARAQALGLYAYTLTDHCECQKFEERYRARVETAWEQMGSLTPQNGLRFYRGIELGQPNQDTAAADAALQGRAYDFVIGSIHNIRDFEDFFFLDYTGAPEGYIHSLLTAYWQELLEMIAWGRFDALGHLTYPLRYIQGEHGIPVDLEKHQDAIDQVLTALIKSGKALEVNTSGLRQKIGRTLPDLPLLKRYHDLGGRLVTLGSDAHCTADLAKGIDQGMETLKAAGFTHFALYVQRQPQMLPLE